MSKAYLSFYLGAYRIHVHVDTLRRIGSPSIICFLLGNEGKSLALAPYSKKDFHSHRVPQKAYAGGGGLDVSSFSLCHLLADSHEWNMACSYRVPGEILEEKAVALFDLTKAEKIERQKQEQ